MPANPVASSAWEPSQISSTQLLCLQQTPSPKSPFYLPVYFISSQEPQSASMRMSPQHLQELMDANKMDVGSSGRTPRLLEGAMKSNHWDEPRIGWGAEDSGFPKIPSKAWIQDLGATDKALRQIFPTPTDSGFPSGTVSPTEWGPSHLLSSVSPRPSALGE